MFFHFLVFNYSLYMHVVRLHICTWSVILSICYLTFLLYKNNQFVIHVNKIFPSLRHVLNNNKTVCNWCSLLFNGFYSSSSPEALLFFISFNADKISPPWNLDIATDPSFYTFWILDVFIFCYLFFSMKFLERYRLSNCSIFYFIISFSPGPFSFLLIVFY